MVSLAMEQRVAAPYLPFEEKDGCGPHDFDVMFHFSILFVLLVWLIYLIIFRIKKSKQALYE